jgi:hypothetical protein
MFIPQVMKKSLVARNQIADEVTSTAWQMSQAGILVGEGSVVSLPDAGVRLPLRGEGSESLSTVEAGTGSRITVLNINPSFLYCKLGDFSNVELSCMYGRPHPAPARCLYIQGKDFCSVKVGYETYYARGVETDSDVFAWADNSSNRSFTADKPNRYAIIGDSFTFECTYTNFDINFFDIKVLQGTVQVYKNGEMFLDLPTGFCYSGGLVVGWIKRRLRDFKLNNRKKKQDAPSYREITA